MAALEFFKNKTVSIVLIMATIAVTMVAVYYVVGRGMEMVFWGIAVVFMFLLCFFSVKLSLFVIIFSMLLSPEIGAGATATRAITLRAEDILLLVMTIAWLFRMAIFKNLGLIRKNTLNAPIIAYSGLILLSTILGSVFGTTEPLSGLFFCLKLIEYFFLFYVVVNYIHDESEIHQLLTTMLIVCGIVCVYGIFQAISGGDVAAPFEGSRGERNTLGGYLVLMGAVAAGIILYTESTLERILLSVMLIMAITVMLFSISRSSWLGTIVATLVLFFTTKRRRSYFLMVLVLLGVFPFVVPEVVRDRLLFTFFQQATPGEQVAVGSVMLDTSTSARLFSYQLVLQKFMNHPIFGYGVTGFGFLDGQYFRNLIEIGIVGSLSFFWLLMRVHKVIKNAIRSGGDPGRLHGMLVGFYAGFWGLLAHALSANTFIIVRIAEPFWCLMGLCVVYVEFYKEKGLSVLIPAGVSRGTKKEIAMRTIS